MSDIVPEENMWYPGPEALYTGKTDPYSLEAHRATADELVQMVQERAQEDGEWVIENGLYAGKEELMRKMIEWVSRPDVIVQCADANLDKGVSVDWVCRELANAAKQIAGGVSG